ncbi:hypothetical protein [Neobacillus sp. LXY-1]|uniref:hypothetical protein n=1 Tax=Neobacillus sp. LXY-1 TaxID=3379133 RepID=UPI003EE034AB
MKKSMILSVFMLLMLAAGCSNEKSADHTAYDLRKDRSSPNFMSKRGDQNRYSPENVANRDKNQQHLVEDDITNQNPNFLDLNGTGSGSEAGAGNQGNDINQAKQVIAATNEFTTDRVWINGDRMWVTVHKKGMLSHKERDAAEARLHRKLIQALPRYNIEVKVQEDRR